MFCHCKFIVFCSIFFINVLSAKNIVLTDAIKQISKDGLQIIYSNEYIQTDNYKIDNKLAVLTASQLKNYLNSIGFELVQIKERLFIIKPLNNTNKANRDNGLIVGSVYDSLSKTKIHNVTITHVETHKKHVANNGIFSIINLSTGKHVFLVKAQGYYDKTINIDLENLPYLNKDIYLQSKPLLLENVLITASQYAFNRKEVSNQKTLFSHELTAVPSNGNDPLRAIKNIAGLTSNGISAKSYVRGGKLSESEIVLNGMSLKSPYHFNDLSGIFSILDLSYTENLSLYAGVFPAKFGNHISSVMNINTVVPDRPFFMDTSIGFFNSHLTFGGNISTNSGYLASIRTGGDLFELDLVTVELKKPHYDDVFVSVWHDFGNAIEINANILTSKSQIDIDLFQEGEISYAKDDGTNIWFQVKNTKFDNLSINSQFYYHNSQSNRSGSLNDENQVGTLLKLNDSSEIGLSSDFNYKYRDNLTLTLGFDWKQVNHASVFELDKVSENFITELLSQPREVHRRHVIYDSGNSLSLYTNIKYQFNEDLFADFGLRLDRQSWIDDSQISPRFNVKYIWNETTYFKLGLGRHQQAQNIEELILEDEELNYFNPEVADVLVFEVFKKIDNDLSIRAEAYYKDYKNVSPYYENLFVGLHLNPELFADRVRITPNSAKAKGLDVTLAKQFNKFSWSVAYSYIDIKDIFDEGSQHRSWDSKNGFKVNANWQYNNWDFSSFLNYHDGWSKTSIDFDDEGINVQERNSDRYKSYLSLDLRAQYHFKIKKTDNTIWFQVTNAQSYVNQCCTDYTYELNDDYQLELNSEIKLWDPLIPSFGINLYFD